MLSLPDDDDGDDGDHYSGKALCVSSMLNVVKHGTVSIVSTVSIVQAIFRSDLKSLISSSLQ